MSTALPPGSVIGVLGGGQLGRMIAQAAGPLGYHTHIFAPSRGPATQVCDRATIADYDDEEALAAFAEAVDAVTFEFENVPAATAAFLAERVPVRPNARSLEIAQHRLKEKTFVRDEVGVPTAPFHAVTNAAELAEAMEKLGTKGVLKTCRFGYDGKGQTFVEQGEDMVAAWARVAGDKAEHDCILEGFVPFELEASVVVARAVDGSVAAFDLVENRHEHHILKQTLAPAQVSGDVMAKAREIAERIVTALDYVGVMGVEMFLTADGGVLVNEMAPRPHNSGHWTIDGAVCSQFEQCVRAVMGLPLGSPERRGDVVMTNVLGHEVDAFGEWLADGQVKIHLYGKAEAREGRKMGHLTRVLPFGALSQD